MKSLFWTDQSSSLKTLELPQFKLEPGISFTYIQDLKSFILFGGLKSQGKKKDNAPPAKKNPFASKTSTVVQEKVFQIQQVYLYSIEQKAWRTQACTGKFPQQRIYHYVSYNSPYLLVYGGMDKKLYSDIYILNCQNWVWKKLVVLDSHVPRFHGCMISYITNKNNKRFLMGGVSAIDKVDVLGDIWMLSLEGVIDSNNNELPGAFWSKIDNQTIQNQFVPVRNFTADVISEDKSFIFGGFTSDSKATANTYTFDMINYKIQKLQTKGSKPSARGGHQTCLIKQNYLIMLGGQSQLNSKIIESELYLYHININTWEKVIPGGNSPHSLINLCIASPLNNNKGQMMILSSAQSTGLCGQYSLQELVSNQQYKINLDKFVISQKLEESSVLEDINEGYQLNQNQKKKIQQLETKLRQTRENNSFMRNKIQKLKSESPPASSRFTPNRTQFSSQLLNLLLLQHKKRKFLQLKSIMLQNTIKDTQKLVVKLNQFSEPQARAKHIRIMKDYRVEMEQIWNKEKVLRKQINTMNLGIGIDLNKIFTESLSTQQAGLFSQLK